MNANITRQLMGKPSSPCIGNFNCLFLTSSDQVYYFPISIFILLLTLYGDLIGSYMEAGNLINKTTKLSYSWVCPASGVVYKGIYRAVLEFSLTQQQKCSYSNPFPIMILLLPALCRWGVRSLLSGQIWFPLGIFWLPPWLILSLIIFQSHLLYLYPNFLTRHPHFFFFFL